MKTLSSPVTTEIAAQQSGWAECYDIYLKSALATPWGTTSVLRLTSCAVGPFPAALAFFTPKISPEPAGTQGNAASYYFWPLAREIVKSDAKFTNDKLRITASNVTTDFAQMILAIDWYDTPIVIRKVPLSIASPTADDCAILWSGQLDSIDFPDPQIVIEASNDLASLQATAPRENMHRNCRFRWADDQCTKIRYLPANYKTGTVGSSSTTTLVNSADFTEDSGSSGTYGTDLVNALADGNISASSDGGTLTNLAVTLIPDASSLYKRFNSAANGLAVSDGVVFSGTTPPTGLTFGTTYYVRTVYSAATFSIAAAPLGPELIFTTAGSAVKVSTTQNFSASGVKSGNNGYWKLGNPADWGTLSNGFYQIPDPQAGLKNEGLKPYIQFDFGSAKTPRLWRLSSLADIRLEELVRLVVFFSSTNNSTWKHETYFEMPPVGGTLYECLIPTASTARYWRICVRSRWAQAVFFALLNKVYAYETSRHYWRAGRITFASNTTTVALQNVSRAVRESYSGQIVVAQLPVAPTNGDTFTIQRGCARTFNDCCTRQNWENFGGFLDLPYQTVIR